jgi:hypothetical protein
LKIKKQKKYMQKIEKTHGSGLPLAAWPAYIEEFINEDIQVSAAAGNGMSVWVHANMSMASGTYLRIPGPHQ